MVKVVISGATGFLGGELAWRLEDLGHRVAALSRRHRRERETVIWDPNAGRLDSESLTGADAVVHLAGESVAGRWTKARRRAIRDSRVLGTALLARSLAGLAAPPRVLVCASGVNVYGHGGDAVLTETSPSGNGFLAGVCREWEAAADPARAAGIRVVHLRFGLVLGRDGGALPRMLPLFRLGLGGVLGSGRQYMSWITLDDAVGVIMRAVEDDSLTGPVNAVAPGPVTNREFTRTLARALRRPAVLPVPAAALRLALGRAADELLLSSLRVQPAVLQASGHPFSTPDLPSALAAVLA